MKKVAAAVLAATVLVFFSVAACGADKGTITKKQYVPERHWTTQECAVHDKNGTCTVHMPVQHTDPECYRLDLKDRDGSTGSVCVAPATYERVHVGDYWAGDK